MPKPQYLDEMARRVLVFDGATGTNLQTRNLTANDFGGAELEGCNEILVLTRPDVIDDLHSSFLAVGADVVETDTFGAMAPVLAEYALENKVEQLNLAAARIAREAADRFATPDHPRFVAGSIGPGTKLPSLGQISFETLRDAYTQQALALIEGDVDLFIIETCYDLLQAKAAMIGVRAAMKSSGVVLPIQVQVTIETTGRMLLGSEIGAALVALEAMKPDVLGLNCATGPEEMWEHVRHLSKNSPIPISVLPNAGLPSVVDGKTHYPLTPSAFGDHHRRFVEELGVSAVGGCCGTTPEHIAQAVEVAQSVSSRKRHADLEPSLTSIYSPVTLHQDTSFLVIGERTNANGSKQFREAMLEADWDACLKIAKQQVSEGSHVIDLCVDYVGRDGTADMNQLASQLATQSTVPIVLDSTEPEVMETGLQWMGGKAVLNSANLEDGEAEGSRLDRVFKLASTYGCAVICLLIDEEGQARDFEWKMRVARRIHDLATTKYNIKPSDLIFDALTFPLSTGEDSLRKDALATIEAIRQIKSEMPEASTTLGISNVSFGLNPAARQVLNSVFLYECMEAGLDSAIVHAAKILPLNKIDPDHLKIARDLIYDRRADGYDPLASLLEAFADVKTVTVKEDLSLLPIDERLKRRIIDGDKEGLEADLTEGLVNYSALELVNDILLDGMKVVGELFGSGQMQLPFVLQSAECMKSAVTFLEPHMEKADGSGKGSIVLATVKGDVHDIGKNLVDIILTNNGYEVHNIGIKVGIGEMVEKLNQVNADALGMSGLLVKSTIIMRENLEELNQRGLSKVPVLLGGAALTRRYVEHDLRSVYNGRVFYGRDAFEGLNVMDKLGAIRRGELSDDTYGREIAEARQPANQVAASAEIPARSPDVSTDNEIFTPPFVGSRVVRGIAIDEIAEYLNLTALLRNQWGFRPDGGESDDEFKQRLAPKVREHLDALRTVLVPQVAYGFFAANSDGNDLVIYTDESRTQEWKRLSFPRQSKAPFLCIADFFAPRPKEDWAAFSIVTMGQEVSKLAAKYFANDEYQQYLFTHGVGVEMAEALAEFWHRRIREEWGFAHEDGPSLAGLFRQQYRGGRYSWGYPACPDLTDNATAAELVDATRIGITVNEDTGWQFQPEQSTAALICHHPQAKYFIAK